MKTSIIVNFQLSAVDGVGEIVATAPEFWGDAVMLEDGNGYLNWKQYEDIGKADVTIWQGDDDDDPLQEQVGDTVYLDNKTLRYKWVRTASIDDPDSPVVVESVVISRASKADDLRWPNAQWGLEKQDADGNPLEWDEDYLYEYQYEVADEIEDDICIQGHPALVLDEVVLFIGNDMAGIVSVKEFEAGTRVYEIYAAAKGRSIRRYLPEQAQRLAEGVADNSRDEAIRITLKKHFN